MTASQQNYDLYTDLKDENGTPLFNYVPSGSTVRFTVYDRWGEKVFETTQQTTGWDGTYKGKDLNPGVFTYVYTINFDDGSTISKTGSVTLIR